MQGIYTYIPETNNVPKEYNVAAIIIIIIVIIIIIKVQFDTRWQYRYGMLVIE
jgi:hypothetical protein